jgi:predicted nucleic acid-binding protein
VVSLWVVNASPIILLTKARLLEVLRHLGSPVVIPEAAVHEVQQRGASHLSVQSLAQATWLVSVDPGPIPPAIAAFGLGAGESAVLAHALANPGSGAILDDQAARRAAAMLGIPHQGTLALILHAKRAGLISLARPVVELLRSEGMYLSDQLMNHALAQVGE